MKRWRQKTDERARCIHYFFSSSPSRELPPISSDGATMCIQPKLRPKNYGENANKLATRVKITVKEQAFLPCAPPKSINTQGFIDSTRTIRRKPSIPQVSPYLLRTAKSGDNDSRTSSPFRTPAPTGGIFRDMKCPLTPRCDESASYYDIPDKYLPLPEKILLPMF